MEYLNCVSYANTYNAHVFENEYIRYKKEFLYYADYECVDDFTLNNIGRKFASRITYINKFNNQINSYQIDYYYKYGKRDDENQYVNYK